MTTKPASPTKKLIYRFEEGDASMKDLLGGKGSGLSEMVRLGLPVPPGFIITTETCREYFDLNQEFPPGLLDGIRDNIRHLEMAVGREFGSKVNPLLVSVRSGAKVSMPGMMDTILNLGINDDVVQGLATLMGDPRPAYDAYRRFLQMYSSVVLGMDSEPAKAILADHKGRAGVKEDYELTASQVRAVIEDLKKGIRESTGADVPVDPWDQLFGAVASVFGSWNNPRAIFYRGHYGIPHDLGTAVSIVSMVYGNLGPTSGTGVLFTRDPANGKKQIYGEFLTNAQGEDIVAGIRTPQHISGLAGLLPGAHKQLMELAQRLEKHYRDVQDVEFTIEKGRLFILQCRSAKRTPLASVKTAVDLVAEGLITREEALGRINALDLSQLLVPQFKVKMDSRKVKAAFLAAGFGASPGAATGKVYFDADEAVAAAENGTSVVLVRPETKPDDIHGIAASAGVLTSRGGMTSHAAVVARGIGKPCIVGCEDIRVDLYQGAFFTNGHTIHQGEEISIDGTTGKVYAGKLATVKPGLDDLTEAKTLLSWADQVRTLGVMANADTPADAAQAVAMGAEGIGLCRTEHMFLDPTRLPAVRQMLLNAEVAEQWRREHPDLAADPGPGPEFPAGVQSFYEALDQVRQLQTDDFVGILRAMGSRPVIIRLLDAPLHEFLPPYENLLTELVELRVKGAPSEELSAKEAFLRQVDWLREANPMLGHRGCRLGLTFPAIFQMQVEAIMTASAKLIKEGIDVHPEVMIPLTVHVEELRRLRLDLTRVANQVQERLQVRVPYNFGTMIEMPRAALTAGELAKEAEFFSFGTNDLTQTTFGFSRDDAEGKFLRFYVKEGILPIDPFATIDPDGVGVLIKMGVAGGRKTRPDLEIGICGEHGGDPASIAFCHQEGLNYVSCSPFRVPVARLAAAQAALAVKNPSGQ